MASGAILGMIQAGANMWGQDRQHRNQQDLMNQQMRNQMALNQQGHDLQYQQWLQTNYPKQIEMMKKAGLNPALMYAKGGPGGTTGSQTGGSASGGQAASMAPMDVANLSLVKKQGNLLDAQAAALRSQAGSSDAQARKSNADAVLSEIEGRVKQLYQDDYIAGLRAEWEESGNNVKLQEIAIALKENGIHNDLIATVIGGMSGWDLQEDGALDKKVGLIPEGLKSLLEDNGINIDPSISRRSAMNIVIGAVALGKIALNKVDKVLEFLVPKKK
jgi:hypothetical protein